jgi:hypothetical protein
MGEYLEEMRKAKESKLVPVIEFMQDCDPKDNRLYCFVEAEMDKVFYNSKIRNIAGSNPSTRICRRKQAVIDVHADLSARADYKLVKKGYFVDRDFQDTPLPSEIYVTPHHSLENFFTQKSTIEVILEEIFKMTPGSNDFINSIELYEKLELQFHQRILLLNVFLICQFKTHTLIAEKLNVDSKVTPILKQIVSSDLTFVYNLTEISSKERIESLFHVIEVEQSLWDASLAALIPADWSSSLRGKFELKFLYSFMDKLRTSVKTNVSGIWTKTYQPTHLEENQILYLLTDKVFPPQCLRDYIGRLHG